MPHQLVVELCSKLWDKLPAEAFDVVIQGVLRCH